MRWSLFAFMAAIAAITAVVLWAFPEPAKDDPWLRMLAEGRASEAGIQISDPVEIEAEGPVLAPYQPIYTGENIEPAAMMPKLELSSEAGATKNTSSDLIFAGCEWSPPIEPASAISSRISLGEELWHKWRAGNEEFVFGYGEESPRFEFSLLDPVEQAKHRPKELGSGNKLILWGLGAASLIGAALAKAKHHPEGRLIKRRRERSEPQMPLDTIQMGQMSAGNGARPFPSPKGSPAVVPRSSLSATHGRKPPPHPKSGVGLLGAALLAIAAAMFAAMVTWS